MRSSTRTYTQNLVVFTLRLNFIYPTPRCILRRFNVFALGRVNENGRQKKERKKVGGTSTDIGEFRSACKSRKRKRENLILDDNYSCAGERVDCTIIFPSRQ